MLRFVYFRPLRHVQQKLNEDFFDFFFHMRYCPLQVFESLLRDESFVDVTLVCPSGGDTSDDADASDDASEDCKNGKKQHCKAIKAHKVVRVSYHNETLRR